MMVSFAIASKASGRNWNARVFSEYFSPVRGAARVIPGGLSS
jgi:hypothetical protein